MPPRVLVVCGMLEDETSLQFDRASGQPAVGEAHETKIWICDRRADTTRAILNQVLMSVDALPKVKGARLSLLNALYKFMRNSILEFSPTNFIEGSPKLFATLKSIAL